MSESQGEPPPWLDRILMFFSSHNIAAYLVVNERLFSGGQRGEVEMLEKPAREKVKNNSNGRQKILRTNVFNITSSSKSQETNCNIL